MTLQQPYQQDEERVQERLPFIDNRNNKYVPIHLQFDIPTNTEQQQSISSSTATSCQVTCMCRYEVLYHPLYKELIRCIEQDVYYCLSILPQSVQSLILRTKLWINHMYCYTRRPSPEDQQQHHQQQQHVQVVNHITTHHATMWLQQHYDNIDKVHGIEIYNFLDYIRMRQHWNGSGLLLHEYCHLIHQHILGLENQHVQNLYHQIITVSSQKYEKVLRRDWAGKVNTVTGTNDDTDCAYCMINVKEFFAEMSVIYLAKGHNHSDYYSMANPDCIEDCSPPITEPIVRQRLMNINVDHKYDRLLSIPPETVTLKKDDDGSPPATPVIHWFTKLLGHQTKMAMKKHIRCIPHCNKFYPFTSGQLQWYDAYLYEQMKAIWDVTISQWKDPYVTAIPTRATNTATTNHGEEDCYICFWKWVPLRSHYPHQDKLIQKGNNLDWYNDDHDDVSNESDRFTNNYNHNTPSTSDNIIDDTVDL